MELHYLKYIMILRGKIILITTLSMLLLACEDFVEIKETKDRMLAEQVFQNDAMSNAAIGGLYRNMRSLMLTPMVVSNSVYANDIMPYTNTLTNTYYTFNIQATDTSLPWNSIYGVIYGANNALEKLASSTTVSEANKKLYIAEAKFLRAMGYFYLVNFFGDVPLVLTTDVNTNKLIPRTPVAQVYDQIIADLKDAKADLPDDYNHAANQRVRANKWVATALLARVYLYQKDYTNADIEANAVIGSGKYSLLNSATGIFTKNNNEAIFQFANNSTETNTIVSQFIYSNVPGLVCTSVLLDAFEIGDQRKSTWIRTTIYASQPVSVPYKFTSTAVNPSEYNTIIRLAEMYLIRAEARAMRDDFSGCADNINLLRLQHGGLTTPLSDPTDQEEAMTMILHERQVELFTEGCHRFFDLKRTGRIDAVMSVAKPDYWKSTAALYPIPLTELQRNPNLTPNPGYE